MLRLIDRMELVQTIAVITFMILLPAYVGAEQPTESPAEANPEAESAEEAEPDKPPATPEEAAYQRGLDALVADDLFGAMQALEEPANNGYAPAQSLLAYILDKAGENKRAAAMYRKAADQGDPVAELGLGSMYVSGEGVERDVAEGLRWITRAAEQGHGPAIIVLSDAYQRGDLGLEVSKEMAIQWLERGVTAGYEPATQKLEELRPSQASEPETNAK